MSATMHKTCDGIQPVILSEAKDLLLARSPAAEMSLGRMSHDRPMSPRPRRTDPNDYR